MASIVNVVEAEGSAEIVLLEWVGFGPGERTWKSLDDRIHDSSPELFRSELAKLPLT